MPKPAHLVPAIAALSLLLAGCVAGEGSGRTAAAVAPSGSAGGSGQPRTLTWISPPTTRSR